VSEDQVAEKYPRKAIESLSGAQSECAHGRFNICANRAYYAAFQGAIAALMRNGIRAKGGHRAHTFVQSEFVGKLINRRHLYPPGLRNTLSDLLKLRHRADYRDDTISEMDAIRALRRSREIVDAIISG
jgi:uncharacterized protein (UPF0332 family)